ncbi:MAG TPA: hypothetical protein DDX92_08355 [Flavobacteriales bacterium]|nr:hypothetical protein [Flavobacteriales bacterium]
MKSTLAFLIVLSFCTTSVVSQEVDSLKLIEEDSRALVSQENNHNPKKATLLSVFIPGGGQVYNKKYWKIPIIYGGMGVAFYLSQRYRNDYQFYRSEYIKMIDGDSTTVSEFEGIVTAESIGNTRNTYREWMETSYIFLGLIYVLQIVDANVDAHLMYFDVSDEISLNVEPTMIRMPGTPVPALGMKLAFSLH